MLIDSNYKNNELELAKLVSFAYDLYKEKLDFFDFESDLFPRLYTYNGDSYRTFKIDKGCVWGFRGYPSHSECQVYTQLGLTVGDVVNDKLNFNYAIMFSVDNENEYSNISIMEIEEERDYKPKLKYSRKWENLTKQQKINLFVNSMSILGFNAEDIKKVIDGTLTARQAYINIAPEDKKYKQWINVNRRYYYFENNVVIGGTLSNIKSFDSFPFPFDGEVIIDCSKAKTSCIKINSNERKIKLININKNRESIWYADLRNAIIEEVIDLSKVDATGTKFGHHKVINLETSIAKLQDMDLTLACDINGKNLGIKNENQLLNNNSETNENMVLKIYANVDTPNMILETTNTIRDGIGLVRTETLFYSKEKIEKYISLLLSDDYDIEESNELLKLLEEFKIEQRKLLELIFNNFEDENITIRLLDFRINDIAKSIEKTRKEIEEGYYMFDLNIRGAQYYGYRHEFLLKAQIDAIFEMCKKYNRKINILVPFIEDIKSLEIIKGIIYSMNETYNINYKLGAMIENIQSIYNADRISKLVDFISFGLNDLTESIIKKSRDTQDNDFYYLNKDIKEKIIEAIYRAKAGNKNVEIGVCGEHTNYIENLEFLSSIDIQYISTIPSMIPILKENLNRIEDHIVLVKK